MGKVLYEIFVFFSVLSEHDDKILCNFKPILTLLLFSFKKIFNFSFKTAACISSNLPHTPRIVVLYFSCSP